MLEKEHYWLSDLPKVCDLCKKKLKEIFIDGGITNISKWGIMCLECYRKRGMGLGAGLGQVYDAKDGKLLFGRISLPTAFGIINEIEAFNDRNVEELNVLEVYPFLKDIIIRLRSALGEELEE